MVEDSIRHKWVKIKSIKNNCQHKYLVWQTETKLESHSGQKLKTKMTTQEYDQLEKIFNGSWKFDRDENREAWMDAAGKIWLL